MKLKRILPNKEKLMRAVFFISACVSIAAVLLICIFLFANGLPAMQKIGIGKFLVGRTWNPGNDEYGIYPMIIGSLYVTGIALAIGVPIGILTAVFMAKFCPKKLYGIIKPAIDLLAGIPSIVYGFFGLMVVVPFIRNTFGGSGSSVLAASTVLGIMILPTIIGVCESALRAVPESYYEGSLALGASHERSVFRTVVPAAIPGILSGIILSVGRIVGETVALIYTSGSVAQIPQSLMGSGRTLSVHMYALWSEGFNTDQAYATAVVLLVIVAGLNALSSYVARKITKGKK